MTLQEDLDRLKKADPETWQAIYEKGFNSCNWPEDLIQGEIQRACQKRKWYAEIHFSELKAFARISRFVGDFQEVEEIAMREGDSPAAAILSAYLEACEEQP